MSPDNPETKNKTKTKPISKTAIRLITRVRPKVTTSFNAEIIAGVDLLQKLLSPEHVPLSYRNILKSYQRQLSFQFQQYDKIGSSSAFTYYPDQLLFCGWKEYVRYKFKVNLRGQSISDLSREIYQKRLRFRLQDHRNQMPDIKLFHLNKSLYTNDQTAIINSVSPLFSKLSIQPTSIADLLSKLNQIINSDRFYQIFGRLKLGQKNKRETIKQRMIFLSEKYPDIFNSGPSPKNYLINNIYNQIKLKPNGQIDASYQPKITERVVVVADPKKLLQKLIIVQKIKTIIKQQLESNVVKKQSHDIRMVATDLLVLYLKKITKIESSLISQIASIDQTKKIIGWSKLTITEKKILSLYNIDQNHSKNWSRQLAKNNKIAFSSIDLNNFRSYLSIIKQSYKLEADKENILAKNDIDYQSFTDSLIPSSLVKIIIVNTLKYLGLFTSIPETRWPLRNDQPAQDGKWRISFRGQESCAINPSGKVVFLSKQNISIEKLIKIILAHEFTHILQSENREYALKNDFSLNNISFSGGELFSEGGAKYFEEYISKKLFNDQNLPKQHYLLAIRQRLMHQGNFFACAKSYYKSSVSIIKPNTKTDDAKLLEKRQALLLIATGCALRLFRPNIVSLNKKSSDLYSAKDLVYLQQYFVIKNLIKHNKNTDCLLPFWLGDVDLETMITLAKLGLIDKTKIITPFDKLEKVINIVWQQFKPFVSIKKRRPVYSLNSIVKNISKSLSRKS